jgi:branched-chain amino acid transport system ATP-binding protein
MPMLEVRDVHAGYGGTEVLFGLSLVVGDGEFVTLLGRNGMGKSTTVKTVMGMLKPTSGDIVLDKASIAGLPPFRVARHGIGLVPEGRLVCANLSVKENLVATARLMPGASWTLDSVYALFPLLRARAHHMGNQLSGGEQQLLAIGRALMTNPRLLILDEATEGLAPIMRREVWRCLRVLRDRGESILIIDKHIKALSQLADRHYVIEKGRIVWYGDAAALRRERRSLDGFLGVA